LETEILPSRSQRFLEGPHRAIQGSLLKLQGAIYANDRNRNRRGEALLTTQWQQTSIEPIHVPVHDGIRNTFNTLYECTTATGAVTPTRIGAHPHHVNDVAPATRWEYDIMEPEGISRMREVIGGVKAFRKGLDGSVSIGFKIKACAYLVSLACCIIIILRLVPYI
jgi:hypothetical protein